MTIDSSDDFSAKDGKIRAIVRSKYTYGKLVKGDAIVSLTPVQSHLYYRIDQRNRDSVVKTIKIDGKGTVEFDVGNDLRLHFTDYTRSRNFDLKAVVIEELTGRNHSASKSIMIHQSRYKITPSSLDHDFIPGEPIKFGVS